MKKISIVSPCYNESQNLKEYFVKIESLIQKYKDKYIFELILVDDYSNDETKKALLFYKNKFSWLRIIECPRNFGVYKATYIGLKETTGDWIVPMLPVDLQDPIEELDKMINIKNTKNVTGVFGKKIDREEGFIPKSIRRIFYGLLSITSLKKINQNVGEFGIIDSWVVEECVRRNDYYPYIRGMISNITDDIFLHDYTWRKRNKGKSNYNFYNYYDHAINAFISAGNLFFRPLCFLGYFISLMSIVFGIYNIILYVSNKTLFTTPGIATIIVLISFFMGFLFVFLGFLGEYVIAIHSQIRGHDNYNTSIKNKNT